MAPATAAQRQPWRWPLGWLFVLGFTLGLGMWGGLAWLWLHWANYEHGHYPWMATVMQLELPYMVWLAVAALGGLGGLGLVMTINNVIRQAWKRALRWLLLAGLAAVHCAASLLPMVVVMGGGITPDVPQEEAAAGK